MRLDYDDHGRLRAAAPLDLKQATVPHEKASRRWLFGGLFGGHHKAEPVADPGRVLDDGAAFEYDKNGMLASVVTPDGKVSYTYANGWVTGVARAAKGTDTADAEPEVRKFEYAPNGQLAGELAPDGTRISYDVRPQEGGRQVRISAGDAQVVANYDAADRPLALRHADGTQTTWHYAEDGVVTAGAVLPTGELGRITWSGDGRQRTVRASDGPAVREELDDAGRMVKLAVESTPAAGDDVPATAAVDLPMDEVLTQQWGADGTLRSLDLKTHAILPEYDEHGRVKRVMRVKPTNSGRFTEWQETRFDDLGRVTEVNDNTRGHFALGYDADGNIAGVTTTRLGAEQQEERISYAFTRDALGRITGVTSPGGQETWAYDAAGDPSTVLMKRGQAEARIDFSEGRPKRLSQFDGGRIEFDYQEEGPAKGHLKDVRTPVIDLNYRYDSDGALAEVACGDACRVIYGYDSTGNLASLEYCPAAGS
jgi:YD repeat-containing protein